jgi:hypothetical protein
MTPDPMIAVLDQLAACREHLADLDTRETAHHAALDGQLTQLADMVTTIGRGLPDNAALARLDDLDRKVTDLTRLIAGPGGGDGAGYQPRPAPAWWKLACGDRQEPTAELRDWVEHVFRPGYGHLAGVLGQCWPEHDLCLYGLDIASQLWCALYLQPARSPGLLSAQAEYQARMLPALADQLVTETTRCAHNPAPRYPGAHL